MTYRDFDNFDDAIAYVKENPERYVIKPSGTAANVKRRLFVGDEDDGQDVIRVLEAYKKSFPDEIRQFQLQRRVTGVEVAVGAFFNGKEFIYPLNVNFEHKKLFPGNIGPSTGEMGTAMFWSGPNKLFNSTLKKMEAKLASEGYVGYIDLNCIVNGNGIYPLEFTARFGYPTISIQQEGMTTPIGQFLAELAAGANPKLKVKSGFQIGVRVVVSPFPFDDDRHIPLRIEACGDPFQKRDSRRGAHRGCDAGEWTMVRGRDLGCCAGGMRGRANHAPGTSTGLFTHPKHHDSRHVLPR